MKILLRWLRLAVPLSLSCCTAACAACPDAEHRQFDFWVGQWEVFLPDGTLAGENRIEAVAGGCALLESWQGTSGFAGNSLNSYDPSTGRWHQLWIDNRAGRLNLSGAWDGRSMVLTGSASDGQRPGVRQRDRIAWTPAADGSVRQLWERSEDDGRTWTTLFDGRYVRAKRRPAARLFLRAR